MIFKKLIYAICFSTLLLITSNAVDAATFTVTNINDSGAGSLRQAILNANAAAGDDTVNFDPNFFNVPRTITVASLITITGSGALTINGTGRDLLTVSGNNASRIFEVSGVSSPLIGTITFNNLTIANGAAVNSGSGGGGGIGVNNGAFSPEASTVNLVVNNVFFRNNNGGVNAGGAIGAYRNCTLTVSNSVFTGNAANGGGAIYNGSGIGTCSVVNISNSTFNENVGDTVSLGGNGNGVYTISGSTFYNNISGNSRVLFIQTGMTGNTITNTTFFNNQTSQGAIVLSLGATTLTNVTIAGNTAPSVNAPGGINQANGAVLNIGNSIVSGNTNPNGENNFNTQGTSINSQGYNILGSSQTAVTITGLTTGNQLGVNPMLDKLLRDNGGVTRTLALRPNSPAIDAGNPNTFPATDQRGIARPQDGDGNGNARSDIGAFEKRLIDVTPIDVADLDGDAKTDVSIFRPGPGQWWHSRSSDGGNRAITFGLSTDSIVPTDFTGDGKTDIAVFRPSTGQWFVLRSEDSSFYALPFGTNGDVPMPADYDADGKADLAVFRPSSSTWFISRSGDNGTTIQGFGIAGDVPVAADYDGDGRADIAIYRPNAAGGGQWWIQRSSTNIVAALQFGTSTDKTVVGDYTGDGKADIAFWRPSTGFWNILRSEDLSYFAFPFGQSGDVPVPGDYDGDGKFDAGVFRPSNSTWFVQRSTAGTLIQQFGITGDLPLPNAYVR